MKKTLLLCLLICVTLIGKVQSQWVQQSASTMNMLCSVYFTSVDTGYICDENNNLYKTINGGTNWTLRATNGPAYKIQFLNSDVGFGNGNGIIKTVNGGQTWTTSYSPTTQDFCFINSNIGYAAIDSALSCVIKKTIDGGVSWHTVHAIPNTWGWCMFFYDEQHGYLGDQSGYIYKTSDGGLNWNISFADPLGGLNINAIFFPTQNIGYTLPSYEGSVFKTTNGGTTWDSIHFAFPEPLNSVYFLNKDTGYVAGGNGYSTGYIYKTTNGGNTWSLSESNTNTFYSVFFPSQFVGYSVGLNGVIMKYSVSTDIQEQDLVSNFRVYPNPATNNIKIIIPEKAIIEIQNLEGQIIKRLKITDNKTNIDISDFASGVYIIRAQTDNGMTTKKFIKE
jgi:photosystem II stability/assembly factor-like uncharacterized protein